MEDKRTTAVLGWFSEQGTVASNSTKISPIGLCLLCFTMIATFAGCESTRSVERHFVTEVPPPQVTGFRLEAIRERIQLYVDEFGKLPESPDELPMHPDRGNSLEDAWGRKFEFIVESGKSVHVRSLGRDGTPGGAGHDADMEIVYWLGDGI